MPQTLTAATGRISLTAELLATQLATCAAFRNWTGAAWTVEQARERIYHNALPPPAVGDAHTLAEWQRYRPHALIWTADDLGLTLHRDTAGPGCCVESQGRLVIAFEQAVPAAIKADAAEVDRRFQNFIGRVMHTGDPASPGLMDLAGDLAHLPISTLTLRGIARTAPEDLTEIGDAQRAWLDVSWSTR